MGRYYTTADMNNATTWWITPLDPIRYYELDRLFYGMSIGSAAFSTFSKTFWQLTLYKILSHI